MSEVEAVAIGFAIDHYQPQASGGTDAYGNLYWACASCNRTKSDYWPGQSTPVDHKVIQVDHEDPEDHFDEDADNPDKIAGKTELGHFNIELMRLNFGRMTKIRRLRRDALQSEAAIRSGIRMLAKMRLDDLPPALKARAYQIRNRLSETAVQTADLLQATLRALIEEHSRSDLIAAETDNSTQKKRTEYLRKIGVLKPPKRG